MHQVARIKDWSCLWKYDVIGDWQLQIALCSWLVRTSLQGACQAAIKWRMAVVYTSYSLRMSQWKLAVDKRVEDGEWHWQMIQPILWEAVPCLVFLYSPFHIIVHFWSDSCKSDSHLHYLHVLCSNLTTCGIFRLTHSKFCLIRALHFLSRV